ncbi:MAG: VIT1/CCC1 transporter family protein [Ferruginibacter sp.]
MPKQDPADNTIARDIIIGMSDGLIIPFALATGLASADSSRQLILAAGLISAVAGGITMGIGGYFSQKDEPKHHHPDEGSLEKSLNILENIGLDKDFQQQAIKAIEQDHDTLASLVGNEEEIMTPSKNGIIIMIAYMLGGIISVAPYFFIDDTKQALLVSSCITGLLLISVGFLKGKLNGGNPLYSALRAIITGILTAMAAFFVAKFF